MFNTFKNLDAGFRQMRWIAIGSLALSALISVVSVVSAYSFVRETDRRIYVLSGGRAIAAVETDRSQDLPVEVRQHVKLFHQLFFTLDPDEKTIRSGATAAFYLADQSARKFYETLSEKGFYAGVIAANITQRIQADSISVDVSVYPYTFQYYGTETITRQTTITNRALVTRGRLRNTKQSDNNGFGFLIEDLQILDNHDRVTINR